MNNCERVSSPTSELLPTFSLHFCHFTILPGNISPGRIAKGMPERQPRHWANYDGNAPVRIVNSSLAEQTNFAGYLHSSSMSKEVGGKSENAQRICQRQTAQNWTLSQIMLSDRTR